jgi:hypothetical protein
VPKGYDFEPLLRALRKYAHFIDFHKYKNNYDYQLALLMLNGKYYMTNDSIILTENESPFSAVSVLNYEYYMDIDAVKEKISGDNNLQLITGHGFVPFGQAQSPSLSDYADGVDTMQFLVSLSSD